MSELKEDLVNRRTLVSIIYEGEIVRTIYQAKDILSFVATKENNGYIVWKKVGTENAVPRYDYVSFHMHRNEAIEKAVDLTFKERAHKIFGKK